MNKNMNKNMSKYMSNSNTLWILAFTIFFI